ncbi:hypothetical protein SAMN05421766_102118 [Zobellia uliginosa]|uniref:Lipoprotein n=1 Tax=Zobellia uliginosa TaxID=143224 RepID=A0ABY1KLC5_9FLAO|nr:hypothetical protein [Zobellia uliginosa]SIS47295.1 hypothetical protein SAMN05421766_102118 [Zobellia uliginosa]
MKYFRKLFFITLTVFLTSCNSQDKSDYKYSKNESEQFLDEIGAKATISIGAFTERKKQPTSLVHLYTRYPISKTKLEEFNENNGTIINKDDDIWDFTTCTFKDYELINEKNEKLQIVDNEIAVNLQEYSLWDYDNVLCQNLGIKIKLDKEYEKLKGHILIDFEMPGKVNKKIKIPVDITIYDKLPE